MICHADALCTLFAHQSGVDPMLCFRSVLVTSIEGIGNCKPYNVYDCCRKSRYMLAAALPHFHQAFSKQSLGFWSRGPLVTLACRTFREFRVIHLVRGMEKASELVQGSNRGSHPINLLL